MDSEPPGQATSHTPHPPRVLPELASLRDMLFSDHSPVGHTNVPHFTWPLKVHVSQNSEIPGHDLLTGGPQRAQIQFENPNFVPSPPIPRDLDARAKNEYYRAMFRLPRDERLDGHTSCTLWTPFNKLHIPGQMFISSNYICFASKEEDGCHLIIPLREVSTRPHQLCPTSPGWPLSIQ